MTKTPLILAAAVCGLMLGACAPMPAPGLTPAINPAYPAQDIFPTADLQPYPVEPTLTTQPPIRQPMGTPVREPAIHSQARTYLAGQLTTAAENIGIVDSQAVDWPDSCLGVYAPDTSCMDVITPGYIITAQVAAQTYILHTNAAGTMFYLAAPSRDMLAQPAIEAARQALAARFNQPASAFTLTTSEEVTWPDGCLGVYEPNTECTQMLVPGYRLIFTYTGQTITVHTNLTGATVKILP